MDQQPLPDNVQSHKQPKPKGWSYPFKTTELVEALALGDLGEPVEIWFDNSPYRPYRAGANDKSHASPGFPIFNMTHYGPKAKHFGTLEKSPFFSIHVRLVKPEYRQRLLKLLKEEVFPVVAKWMRDIKKSPTWNGLACDYKTRWDGKTLHTAITVAEDKERELFVKKLDLDKEDEDNG